MTLSAGEARVSGGEGVHASGGADLLGLLDRCHFPQPSAGPVTMAVSGGADSMALMVLARAAGLDGTAVHVDHGLRPGSGAEAAVVAQAAAELGFGFTAVEVTVEPGPDLEARARLARYGVLPPDVLTGHTMDDQAETVLLNLARGAGLDGLSAMRDRREHGGNRSGDGGGRGSGQAARGGPVPLVPLVRPVRPLLGLRRAETAEVCRQAGIVCITDPSNSDPRFTRNRMRSELLPLLCDIARRDVVPVLARQAGLIAEDVDLLDDLAATLDPTDVTALRAAPPALARRALRSWLRWGAGHHPPSSAEMARIMDVVAGRRRACELSGGRRLSRSAGRLSVGAAVGAGSAGVAGVAGMGGVAGPGGVAGAGDMARPGGVEGSEPEG